MLLFSLDDRIKECKTKSMSRRVKKLDPPQLFPCNCCKGGNIFFFGGGGLERALAGQKDRGGIARVKVVQYFFNDVYKKSFAKVRIQRYGRGCI